MSEQKQQVLDALATVLIPDEGKASPATFSKGSVVDAGWVSAITIKGEKAGFSLTLPEGHGLDEHTANHLRERCQHAVETLPSFDHVTVVLTGSPPLKPASQAGNTTAETKATRNILPHVKHVVAVLSGKGGVGKSTVSVNIATAMARAGHRVGLVDADIYGPSIPRMLGIEGQPIVEHKKLVPIIAHHLHCLSMGMLIPEDQAMVWRGPMLAKALRQLFVDAAWGSSTEPLDYLVVDMPPGTGDVALSIAKQLRMDAAILVSTPQEVAITDVKKAKNMLDKLEVPILGIVENMAYLEQDSGEKTYVFGKGKLADFAANYDVERLAEVPLFPRLAEAGDKGSPLAKGQVANIFADLASIVDVKFNAI